MAPAARRVAARQLGRGGQAQAPGTPRASRTGVIRRNIGRQKAPKAVQQAQQDLSSAQEGLKQEAQQYISGIKGQQYGVDEGTINKALSKGGGAFQKTMEALQQKAPQVEAFKPETDTQIEDIGLLRNQAGLGSLLQREAGPQYTAGEQALDRMLLGRTPEFNLLRSQLIQGQDALTKEAGKQAESQTQKGQELATKKYGEAQERMLGQITGAKSGIKDELRAAAEAENLKRQKLREGGGADVAAKQEAAILAGFQTDPRMQRLLDAGLVDESKFFNVGGDVDWRQMAGDDQISRFNRIQQLLGKGDMLQAGGTGKRSGFDRAGYEEALRGALSSARQQEDVRQKERMQQIMANLEAQALRENQGAAEAMRLRGDTDTVAMQQAALAGALANNPYNLTQDELNRAASSIRSAGGMQDFMSPTQYTAQDLMSAEDAARLNEIYADLGMQERVQAGGGRRDEAFGMNQDAYQQALIDVARGARGESSPRKEGWYGKAVKKAGSWGKSDDNKDWGQKTKEMLVGE